MSILIKRTYAALPSTLKIFEGGLYLGNFFPGSPVNTQGSELLGNNKTGSAEIYRSETVGLGEKENMWAIIVALRDYYPTLNSRYAFRTQAEQRINWQTSNYDGLYNKSISCNFNKSLATDGNYGGYTDWYVPSLNELGFIAKNLPTGYYVPNRFDAMRKTVYRSSSISKLPQINEITLSSTSTANLGKYNYSFFGQSFDKSKYGSVYHVDEFSSTPIRLIRRINLIEYKG